MPISENGVSFFGSGGHSHNGVNSTIIDVGSYSLFDFSLGYTGSQSRINRQSVNQNAMEDWIVRTINSKVLQPAGLNLAPDTLSGKAIRANTITADQISANTITANELSSNIVLINNIIRSNNFNGSFHANGDLSNSGTTGWAISNTGVSVFSNAILRGQVTANSGSIGGWLISSSSLSGGVITLNSSGSLVMNSTSGSSNYITSVTSSGFRNQWYDGSLNAYALYTIGPTRLQHTGFWPNSGSLSDSAIRESIVYDTNAIYFDGRAAEGGTYSQVGYFSIIRSGSNVKTEIYAATKNNSGAELNYVDLVDGKVTATDGIWVSSNKTISAWSTFATTGSSTTARLTIGGIYAGYDSLGRPSSLRDLKENIVDIDDALSIISDLRPRKYNFKVDAFSPIDPVTQQPWTQEAREFASLDHKYGLIVEEVAEKRPDLLSYMYIPEDDEEPNYLDFSKYKATMWEDADVLVLCIKAIQELHQKNMELEARLQTLEDV